MSRELLCQMANDIGAYFASEPDEAAAVEGIRNHLQRFWEPRMRRQLLELIDSGVALPEPLTPLVLKAVERLEV